MERHNNPGNDETNDRARDGPFCGGSWFVKLFFLLRGGKEMRSEFIGEQR